MKEFNKIRYMPLKYQNEIRSISNPKKTGINLNDPNKNKNFLPLKNINYNNSNFNRNNYLNYHYNNTEVNYNSNFNTNLNQFNNKAYNNFYSNKYKERINNNVKDNFNVENLKKKKNFYVNVNFNLNQNYNIPNINNNKINRSLSVQNYYETKDNINNINNKINLDNNSYNNTILNNNYTKNKTTNSFKSIYNQNNLYLKPINLNNINTEGQKVLQRNNKSYTQIIDNKLIELQSQNKDDIKYRNASKTTTNTNSLTNTNNKSNSSQTHFLNISNKTNIINNNYKNIRILTEPINNNNINTNIYETNNDQILTNLEFKMRQLFKENKTDSKGKNYNIIRKIFEEAINIVNFTKKEKKFLKLILLKYHEIVYAFSQENKLLIQSSQNLQNLNFNLDKNYLELNKKYKIILKENEDMKNILSIQNNNDNNINNDFNNNQNKNNNNDVNENMMYKSIKSMKFSMSDSYKKEEKYEKDNDNLERDFKLINLEKRFNKENKDDEERESRRMKSENIKKRREEFNRLNINDLDSLYFNDKINDIHCYNSKKNYDKVPKIRFLSQCKN